MSDAQQEVDLVKDGWTGMPSYSCLAGTPKTIPPEKVPNTLLIYTAWTFALWQSTIRVDEVVRDKDTAEKLKAWYPGWCKRPCFHDEYLQSFNKPNVTLINTNGKGLDGLSESGFLFDGREYPIDLLVLSTGYQPPLAIHLGVCTCDHSRTKRSFSWSSLGRRSKDSTRCLHSRLS